jgi:hypothetical protein
VIKDKFDNALRLWIPSGEILSDPSECSQIVKDYVFASEAITDFLALEIDAIELCEKLDAARVNIDSYLDDLEFNLFYL